MSWAARRRFLYILCIFAFLALITGGPLAIYLHRPASCEDGVTNQGETAPDRGGPCVLLDVQRLSPHAVLWTRSFKVRDGAYDATAYIENPNASAGVQRVNFRLGLYDSENVLVAERFGSTYVMPNGITPVFIGAIDTGNRLATHAQFCYINAARSCSTDPSLLTWMSMKSTTDVISITNKTITDTTSMPRVSAMVRNNGLADMIDVLFVAVVFDPAGNAFASSQTALPRLRAGEEERIVFTWPQPFSIAVGRIDIIASHPPEIIAPEQAQ